VEILRLSNSGISEARQFLLGGVLSATVLLSTFGGLTQALPGEQRTDPIATSTEPIVAVEPRAATPEPEPLAGQRALLDSGRTTVPYMTQFDGTPWEGSNCGIASIAMVLGAFDITIPTLQIRKSIIGITGDPSYDAGVAWDPLVKLAWRHNFPVNGPNMPDSNQLRSWYLEELDAESRMGRPSILLVHYRSLPGHENAGWWGDHYVVFLGLTADGDVIYHDPAFRGSAGAYKVTDRATFERAWTNTMSGQQRTAIVVGW
jgi:hypothetical protein